MKNISGQNFDKQSTARTGREGDGRKRFSYYAEPATYIWTPSCMYVDSVSGKKCWPSKTDVHCWWDCSPFDWTPFPLPISVSDTNKYHGVDIAKSDGYVTKFKTDYKAITENIWRR